MTTEGQPHPHRGDTAACPPPELGPPPADHRWAAKLIGESVAWYPVPADDHRPLMTESEASLNTTVAGIREREKVRRAGTPADARIALAQAAAADLDGGTIAVAGVPVWPLSIGTLWAFESSIPQLDIICRGVQAAETAWTYYLVTKPREAYDLALRGEWEQIAARVAAIAIDTPADVAQRVDIWFTAELDRIRRLAGAGENEGAGEAVGKPSAGQSPPSAIATPQPAGQ